MNALDPTALALLGLALLVAAAASRRATRARRRARRRIVEPPNSHFTARIVRENETRHGWQNIDLDRIHEINREEVVRLLAKVEAAGIQALRANERAFLDHMTTLAGSAPPHARGTERGAPGR
ncbi:MAG TPA: hypothetical protein VF158_12630 [Longimicrobiales bacterium]